MFELNGKPVIRDDVDLSVVEKYLADLEAYQVMISAKEDSSEEIDMNEFNRLNAEFGSKKPADDDLEK